MSGTKSGGQKARDTNLKKHGEDFYTKIAIKSRVKWKDTPKEERKPWGFGAMSKEARRAAGAKGGSISKRGS